ncbi:hypothetical protein BZA05DRAFT_404116 [Tricharina praecox]|uniref:uncharacterized protein n=1 Tax=Tricharina praecox TaxID=43433 RepID=UPI00221F64C1|nr:uncharacterized protein BZA05DRAFT_404116 [Tricharina praecox]KAI5848009.1 hypothetical protein BZA05DRAFT_404116 [Tricharina praecox]
MLCDDRVVGSVLLLFLFLFLFFFFSSALDQSHETKRPAYVSKSAVRVMLVRCALCGWCGCVGSAGR